MTGRNIAMTTEDKASRSCGLSFLESVTRPSQASGLYAVEFSSGLEAR